MSTPLLCAFKSRYVDGTMTSTGARIHKNRISSPIAGVGKLFDVIDLTTLAIPACFAIALPNDALLRMPGIPPAALPESGRLASGRGTDEASCRASCLGEAAELFSCCEWGNEQIVNATENEIGPAAIRPEALNGFTRGQLRERIRWNSQNADFDWRPAPRDTSAPLDWLSAEDAFGGRPAFIPADVAFIGRRQTGDEAAAAIGDSNGCAAGPDADTAKLAAVLELVERDATGRWWYGQRSRPTIGIAEIDGLGPLAAWLAARSRQTWLFDITTDIGLPVVAAASAEPDGLDVALGFAARLDMKAAAAAAITEMLQMEISLDTARALGGSAGHWARWRREVTMSLPPLAAGPAQPPGPFRPSPAHGASADLPEVLAALARQKIDLWFVDMTRAEIGIPVFRAVSTMLCHYKPRFAHARLLAADARDLQPAHGNPRAQMPLLI